MIEHEGKFSETRPDVVVAIPFKDIAPGLFVNTLMYRREQVSRDKAQGYVKGRAVKATRPRYRETRAKLEFNLRFLTQYTSYYILILHN